MNIMHHPQQIVGITGVSGSGKTKLMVRLIPIFRERGYRVATVKHAHHDFEIDKPGKDSYEHRVAGATEAIVSSTRRWAIIHENESGKEATLSELIDRISPTDIILVEGFKAAGHPKIEVYRQTLGIEPLYKENNTIVAIASDVDLPAADIPVINLNDTLAITDFIVSNFELPTIPMGMV